MMSQSSARLLFARPADAKNINAQAKTVQNILGRWCSGTYRPAVFTFFPPDARVAANANVDIIRIAPDRLWRLKVFMSYMGRFDAVVYPGVHHFADWAALKTRALLRFSLPVITAFEGLLGVEGDSTFDERYSQVAGHPAYSQKVSRAVWRRMEDLHAMASHIVAISPYLVKQAEARHGKKVSMLPLGVDTALFRRERQDRRERLRVVGAGNVRVHKRPQVFLALAQRFPEADFVWFGDGDLRESLIDEAKRSGTRNLEFPGAVSVEQLAREFSTSDIFLLPSRNEGVPKVTQEAAAAGLAQVIFGFYEAPTVKDGVNGFVVWSDEEMFDRLSQLLADRALVNRMGEAGANMAQEWSWDIVAPQWERKILELLDLGRGA